MLVLDRSDLCQSNIIGDKECGPDAGKLLENISPIDGALICHLPQSGNSDVDKAVAVARDRFESGSWSRLSPRERRKAMLRWADLIERDADHLAALETIDAGKPISNSRAVDVPLSLDTVRYYAEAIDKLYGEIGPSDSDRFSYAIKEPLGVIGVIVPWNFPLMMAMWKIAPAIAMGNCVVAKPSELSSLSLLHVARLALEAGIPPGVINVVTGLGQEAGSALSRHQDVDMIAFTGSGPVGRQLMRDSGDSNLKRVSLELGGKSPHIVLADCPDLDKAANAAAWGIFYNQGQVCTAGSRLLVQRSVHEEFVQKLLDVARTIKAGDPRDPATKLGALISNSHMGRVLGYITRAEDSLGSPVLGGSKARVNEGGFYVEPTIFDGVSPTDQIARDEVFGPVLAIVPFDTPEDGVAIANASEYALAAGVWTASIDTAHRFARELRAGMVWINGWDLCDITMPFGGFRQSGFGRDRSLHALEKYADFKSVSISLNLLSI